MTESTFAPFAPAEATEAPPKRRGRPPRDPNAAPKAATPQAAKPGRKPAAQAGAAPNFNAALEILGGQEGRLVLHIADEITKHAPESRKRVMAALNGIFG